jgi:hypothetical protein
MSNLKLIEDYLKELEQENMSVADSTHADPLSAQEGAKQVYENDPRLKAYRHRQAQGRYLKDTGSSAGNLISDIATGLRDAAPLDTIKEAAKLWSAQESQKLYSDAYKTASKLVTPTQEDDAAFELANSQRQDYVDALLADQAAEQFERNAARSPEFSESSFGGESWFGDPLTRGAAYDFGRYSIPGTAASIGTSILTRSPALGAAAFTAPVGSQSYYGSDKGHEQAKKDAFFDMASEYLFERLQLGNLLASGKGIVSKALSQGGLESVQEGMVGIAQLVRDIVQTNENLTPESFAEQLSGRIGEVAPAVKLGFGAGTATGLGYSSAESLLNSRNASGGQQPTPEQVISQVPSVDPSAIQEPYRTTPSVDVVDDSIDMRRRKFLGDMRDIATVAATNPTDLLPGLGEIAAPVAETLAPVVSPKAVISYSNPPVPTDFVFDINGKTVYAMAPGTAEVEQGDTFVQFSDPDGGSNLPEGAPDYVDIKDYLDPEKEISQVEIDRAIARAIQDNFINDGDEFFLGDVRRYYGEAGNNAEPATFEQIEQMEGMNDPEGVFDEIMLNQFPSAYLGPGERFPSPDSAPRQIKKLGGYSRIESKPTEPRLGGTLEQKEFKAQKGPMLRDDKNDLNIEDLARFPIQLGQVKELSKDKRVTDPIPRIPVLDRKLSEARDRLKSLEDGNPPPGFEDDYTQEEIEEDIRLEKANIEALEEERAIKQEEPIEAESTDVDDTPSVEAEAQIPIYGTGKDDAETVPGIPKQVNINKQSGERSVEFYGAEIIPDFDIEKIANRINVKGKGKNKIRIQFAYAPRVMPDGFTTGDKNVDTSGNSYGKAIAILKVNDTIDIIINQARFSEEGSQQLIDKVAKRLGVTNAEIESLMFPGETKAEFAARITIQHELAHANHFIWELMALGKTGYSTSNKDVSRFRSDLYTAFRQDILDFMKRDGATAFRRLGFGDDVKTNKQLIDQLDRAFSTTERVKNETSLESTDRINKATSDLWTVFTELAAYGSEKDIKGKETFIQKFKRVVKMILAKMGINIDKSKLDDVDFNNSFEAFRRDMQTPGDVNTETLASKIADSAVWGKEEVDIPADRTKELEDAIQSKKDSSGKRKPATFNVNRLNKVIEIARGVGATNRILTTLREGISLEEDFNSPQAIAGILKETTGIPYSNIDLQKTLAFLSQVEPEYYSEINTMTEALRLMYNYEVLPGARDDIQAGDIISEIEEIVTDYIKVPIENADNLDELANQTLEDRPDKLIKTDSKSLPNLPKMLESKDPSDFVSAWAEPPKKKGKAKKTNAFEDVVSQQTGVDPNNKDDYNSTGAAYTDPLEQEQRSQDDKAQAEYTGEKEVSRPQARERTTLRSLWGFMYSQSAQTVRRHSGASPTAGVIADTILRAPHEKLREKETKSGRDYVQKKSMAQGQFRMEFQEALDQLTNSGGVISLKVNQQLKDYFNNGTLPANGRVAAAARKLKDAAEKLYAWSEKVGTKYTEDFSLRPLDGGTFPRVYDTEKVASPEGRQKLFDLLASIGIKDNAEAGTYEATDAYNIILESGGFVSGDFTTPARQSQATMKQQEELFNFIERSISRDQLGDLLLTDFQGIVPRFVDKATEMTVYAELFGHRGEHLSELKDKVKQEIVDYNRNSKDVRIDPERVLGDITDLVDILHHRYKADLIPTGGRKFLQAAMNATTMASLTLVSLASMPEFLTATALGSKNPAKFATNLLGGATFAALRGLNGMNKFLTGTVGKGYFDPKTKIGKRAKMLRQLGLFDIASLGEAAAQRYVGPNFIKSGVGTSTNSLPLKTLYRMYGLGNLEKGRFRARQLRAAANMDVYFELTLLTTLTQMQQMMALNNFRQTIVADAKSLSKAGKGKGFKLDSTISQIKSNLKTYGLSNREIKELVRWYEAGHRELHDIPGEFKLDLAGPAQRFVQTAITLPSEGSLPKVFRNPAFAPFLLFKSFITTFGNTFINTAAQRIRFAEGTGASKKYQQGKQIAGMTATAAAMYGAVQFALALGYLIKYGEDENPWEEKTPDWAKFLQDFERTGLFGPLGSVVVQTATPNYWSWKGKDPFDDILDHMIGPIGKQLSNIGQTAADVAQGKDADLEGRLARSIPLTKSEPIRSALGIEPYYTKDDKGKMVRRRTLEKRAEKKAEKESAKKQTILDSITDRAVKELGLSKEEIIGLSRSELDEHMRKEFGFDPDGRKSKASMINQFLESKGASDEEFMASPESEAYKKRQAELQSTRDEASKFVKGMSKADKKKEWEKMKGMTNKQFDEYVELEYGLLLDGRKNRAAMEAQFLELIKGLE